MRQFVYKQTKTGAHCYDIYRFNKFVIVAPSTSITCYYYYMQLLTLPNIVRMYTFDGLIVEADGRK